MTETVTKTKTAVVPFTVEARHPRNCDLLIQSLTGVMDRRMRSHISPTTVTIQGNTRTPVLRDHSPPSLPGMQLMVNPSKCEVEMTDPMHNNEGDRTRLANFLKLATGTTSGSPPNGMPVRQGRMDQDRMKTLCRELLCFIDAGEMVIVHGPKFDMQDVDQLPGEYLLNPGSTIPNTQPKYEKDMAEFAHGLNRLS